MVRKALVKKATGLVVNTIEVEAETTWKPPEDSFLLDEANSMSAGIGDTWDGKKIVKAPEVKPVNTYQDCIDMLSDPAWGSGVPAKIEIVRQVLLRLLETK